MKNSYNKPEDSTLVSIITVCLNSEKYIEQTIRTVLEQTYKRVEYIIIDGGSKDRTIDIVKKYESGISFWISERDSGIYDAMNKGIKLSKGEVIGVINSNDWYEKHAIEDVMRFFERDVEISIVHGNRMLWDQEGKKLKGLILPSKDYGRLIYHTLPVSHATCFVRRSIYSNYGLFDTRYRISADHEFFLRLYKQNVLPHYLNKTIANTRAGGESYSLDAIMESWQISKNYRSGLLARLTHFFIKFIVYYIAKNCNFNLLRQFYYKINPRYT